MASTEKKSLNLPDEIRTFPRGKVEMATIGGVKFGRGIFDPGWKWSEHIKPLAKTQSCQASHTFYQISGHMVVKMDDGTEMEFGPGDVGVIAPGHDGWVVGNEPAVFIDITGMADYAKQY